MRGLWAAVLLAVGTVAAPANATWFEASTDHFVIDADSTEARVRDFADRLERFDAALRMLYNVKDEPALHANRVHVYAASVDTIVHLCGGGTCGSTVRGFYQARSGGSVIFTAMLGPTGDKLDLNPQEVLLHEYSHHFMFSHFPVAYPMWYVEGFAEYNANVDFRPDGSVVLGLPANYRAEALYTESLSIQALLDPSPRLLRDPQMLDVVYGRSWLLTHFLMLDPNRRPQLDKYLSEVNSGKTSLQAAQIAFGDLNKLGSALDRYLGVNRLNAPMMIAVPKEPSKIDIRPLSAGAVAMMPVHMRSTAGVDDKIAKALVPDAERRAAPYPGDARVQDELAEAEYDAGNDAGADAAADRALAADKTDTTAMLYKGQVAVRRAVKAKATDAAPWSAARHWYAMANHAQNEAARPLKLYYESYLAQGLMPPDIAKKGLMEAQGLSPED